MVAIFGIIFRLECEMPGHKCARNNVPVCEVGCKKR